jgi:hypothetical protein
MSQTNKILNHLQKVGSITFLEAWTLYSVRSLPRRIADLKELGYEIVGVMKTDINGQRYMKYSLT